MLDDRVIAEVVREYAHERKRLKASRVEADRRRSRRLGEVERAVKNLLTLVEDGADPQSVLPRLKELEAERAHLQDEGKGARSDVIELHPGIADHYRTIVRDLRAALAERSPERKLEVVASVRSLVEKIVIYPNNDPQSRDLELVGQTCRTAQYQNQHPFSLKARPPSSAQGVNASARVPASDWPRPARAGSRQRQDSATLLFKPSVTPIACPSRHIPLSSWGSFAILLPLRAICRTDNQFAAPFGE